MLIIKQNMQLFKKAFSYEQHIIYLQKDQVNIYIIYMLF